MKLPGRPAAVVVFHPLQMYLGGALLARHPRSELWYAEPAPEDELLAPELHAMAATRAALRLPPEELLEVAPLRMAELGILSAPPSGPAA